MDHTVLGNDYDGLMYDRCKHAESPLCHKDYMAKVASVVIYALATKALDLPSPDKEIIENFLDSMLPSCPKN